jgi:hypothetical protein
MTSSLRNVCGLSLSAACGLALLASTPAHAQLVVSLVQIGGPAEAVSGTQTRVRAALKVSGTLAPASAFYTDTFSTVLTWSGTNGSSASDLYTVNANTGAITSGNAAVIANGTGFLYASDSDAFGTMNTNSVSPTNQRYVNVLKGAEPYPLLSGTISNVTIMEIEFGVTAGVGISPFAEYTFALNSDPLNYGFLNAEPPFNNVQFTSGGGSIFIVPEPDLQMSMLATCLAAAGFQGFRRVQARPRLTRYAPKS